MPLHGPSFGEDVPIYFTCGVSHVPLPANPQVTDRFSEWLQTGDDTTRRRRVPVGKR